MNLRLITPVRLSSVTIPSRFESFSLVSLEAQACGCVPLVADVGGAPEKNAHRRERPALFTTRTNAGRVGRHPHHPLGNPEALEAAGRSAADFVARHTSALWNCTAVEYERVFHTKPAARTGKTPVVSHPSHPPHSTAGFGGRSLLQLWTVPY